MLLWRFDFSGSDADLHAECAHLPGLRVYRGIEGVDVHAYLGEHPGAHLSCRLLGALPVRLRPVQRIEGASHGADAPYHYVVATDVAPEHDAELNDWYEREHLPGLASVPGTVLARRYVCDGSGPRYHACYDLASLATFNSPPWLAVRGTAWSSRVRPHFRNTRRLMFRRI